MIYDVVNCCVRLPTCLLLLLPVSPSPQSAAIHVPRHRAGRQTGWRAGMQADIQVMLHTTGASQRSSPLPSLAGWLLARSQNLRLPSSIVNFSTGQGRGSPLLSGGTESELGPDRQTDRSHRQPVCCCTLVCVLAVTTLLWSSGGDLPARAEEYQQEGRGGSRRLRKHDDGHVNHFPCATDSPATFFRRSGGLDRTTRELVVFAKCGHTHRSIELFVGSVCFT
ncbi:unnamed protein product [Calypogeia fissa]